MVEGFCFISWNNEYFEGDMYFLHVVGPNGRVGVPLILGTAAL